MNTHKIKHLFICLFLLSAACLNHLHAQTAIDNPAGTTNTPAFTDTRAIGFPNGNTFTFSNANWPTCIGWGLPTTVSAVRANLTNASACAFDNLVFSASPASPYNLNVTTNLAGGCSCIYRNNHL